MNPEFGHTTGLRDLTCSSAFSYFMCFFLMRYAKHIVADLDTPAEQCTRTCPPALSAVDMNFTHSSKNGERSSDSTSSTSMTLYVKISGKRGLRLATERMCVMPFSLRPFLLLADLYDPSQTPSDISEGQSVSFMLNAGGSFTDGSIFRRFPNK